MATTATNYKIYYHRVHGAAYLHTIDGDEAVARHPEEWSDKPWPPSAADKREDPTVSQRTGADR